MKSKCIDISLPRQPPPEPLQEWNPLNPWREKVEGQELALLLDNEHPSRKSFNVMNLSVAN
jgi:hypothetical protein